MGNITLASSLSISGVLSALAAAVPQEQGSATTSLVDSVVSTAVTLTGTGAVTTLAADAAARGIAQHLSVFLGYLVDVSRIRVTATNATGDAALAPPASGRRRGLRARVPSSSATSLLSISGAPPGGGGCFITLRPALSVAGGFLPS